MKRKTSATVIMYTVLVFFFVIWIFPIYTAITKSLQVVPEFLRTLVFARPRGDDQFADCTFSPSLDMSR